MNGISEVIFKWRKANGKKQAEFGRLIGQDKSYVSKLEHGTIIPSARTLAIIERVVGVPLSELVRVDELVPITRERTMDLLDEKTRAVVQQREKKFNSVERDLEQSSRPSLVFWRFHTINDDNAITAARKLRCSCGAGTAVLGSISNLLENCRVRLHVVPMLNGASSASFINPARGTVSIIINATDTPERQTYRLSYEIMAVALYIGMDMHSPFSDVHGTPEHDFCRVSTDEFLMPEETVRAMVETAAVSPGQWSLDLVNYFKCWFCVSAHALTIRLQKLGLMPQDICNGIIAHLEKYYAAHKNGEPPPSLHPLAFDVRLGMLNRACDWRRGRHVREIIGR